MPDDVVVHDLREAMRGKLRAQVQAIIDKAEIRGKGTFTPPPLDLDAIKTRADELDPKSQTKADIYRLIYEVEHRCQG